MNTQALEAELTKLRDDVEFWFIPSEKRNYKLNRISEIERELKQVREPP